MSLNEHCLHLFNCVLGSLFIYIFLAFKLPTQLVVFSFGDYLFLKSNRITWSIVHIMSCDKMSKMAVVRRHLTIHAWNRWPLATLERWLLKRVKLYSNISWAGLKVTVRQRWPVRQVRLYIYIPVCLYVIMIGK
jgi:hypothetical protein